VRVVTKLEERASLWRAVIHFLCFIGEPVLQPFLEVLFFFKRLDSLPVGRSSTFRVNFSFLYILLRLGFASNSETSGALHYELTCGPS
jgi:hypothetical protein